MPTSDKKGLLSGFKGLIFEEDPKKLKTEVPLPTPPAATSQAPQMGRGNAVAVDDTIYQQLLKTVLSRPTGYTQFLEALESLENVPMDETTRFRAALAVITKHGLTPDEILRSMTVHDNALELEKNSFAKTVEDQTTGNVAAREKQCDAIDQSVEKYKSEITRLEGMITKLGQDKEALRSEIGVQKTKIESAKQGFEAAVQAVSQKLEADKVKLASMRA